MRSSMYLDGKEITGVYLGDQEISNAYVGDKEVFSLVPPMPLYACYYNSYFNYYFYAKTPLQSDMNIYWTGIGYGKATSSSQLSDSGYDFVSLTDNEAVLPYYTVARDTSSDLYT